MDSNNWNKIRSLAWAIRDLGALGACLCVNALLCSCQELQTFWCCAKK